MFKNSVSAGLIKVSNSSTDVRADPFIGYFQEYNNIINCYWNENIAYDASHTYYLSKCVKFGNNFVLNQTVRVGEGESYTETLLIDALDAFIDYYAQGNFTKWILNNEEGHECEVYGKRQKGSTRSLAAHVASFSSPGR